MLSSTQDNRNKLPWDVALVVYVLALIVVFIGLGLKLVGLT